MGLIKAAISSVSSTMADQWKEYFYCESIPNDTLLVKGVKVNNSRRSQNKGNDNIISNGSGIAVADGQCMIIVDDGKVVELCAEPGKFTFDTSTEPSILSGSLGKSIVDTFRTMGKRFAYAGNTAHEMRVYYMNLKELLDNKFGTANPIPFRVVDSKINLDIDVSLRCFGVYSYKIANPILFYQNLCGNVEHDFKREKIENQLKTEFISALQPAFAKLSALELRPNQIIAHNTELADALGEELSAKWTELRGLEIVSVALGSVTLPPEDAELIKKAQNVAILRDPGMAGATLVGAQAEALKAAAANDGGAMLGLMGMGMVGQVSNMNGGAQGYYAMQQQNQQAAAQQQTASQAGVAAAAVGTSAWKCACGSTATGKFCPECGAKKPADTEGWKCSCGTVNKGKFCQECGAKKPANEPLYKCDKCGWEPKDPKHPPKFCPECGDPFDEKDIQ